MICLFQFDLNNDGIHFILNEKIAIEINSSDFEKLQPIRKYLNNTLSPYLIFSKHPTILSCQLSANKQIDIILSEGLGKYVDVDTKEVIFTAGKLLTDIILEIDNINKKGI
ncbi:hypothetical protein [Bacillus pretiosus]